MGDTEHPSPGSAAPSPGAAELFDPQAFAVRLAEARTRRARVLAERGAPSRAPMRSSLPVPLPAPPAAPSPAPRAPFRPRLVSFAAGLATGLALFALAGGAPRLFTNPAAEGPEVPPAPFAIAPPLPPAAVALPRIAPPPALAPDPAPSRLFVAPAPDAPANRFDARLEPAASGIMRPRPRPAALEGPTDPSLRAASPAPPVAATGPRAAPPDLRAAIETLVRGLGPAVRPARD